LITRTQNGRAKLWLSLRRGAAVFGGLYLVGAAFLGIQIVVKNAESTSAEHQTRTSREQIRTTTREIDKAKSMTASHAPSDLGAVAKLQSAVESSAAKRNCTIAEFRASSEIQPFLTRFAKTTDVSGWGQVETQITLSGHVKDVTATLSGLLDYDIPLEYDALEITRDKVDEAGDARVIAHVTLRVLIRTTKETA
jgi:hypothetical protein